MPLPAATDAYAAHADIDCWLFATLLLPVTAAAAITFSMPPIAAICRYYRHACHGASERDARRLRVAAPLRRCLRGARRAAANQRARTLRVAIETWRCARDAQAVQR